MSYSALVLLICKVQIFRTRHSQSLHNRDSSSKCWKTQVVVQFGNKSSKEGWIGSHGKEFCGLAVPQIIAPPGKKLGATCKVTLEPTAHLRLSRAPRRRELHDSLSSCSRTMRDGHSSKQMSHSQRQPAEFSLRTRHISLFESWSCAQRQQQ